MSIYTYVPGRSELIELMVDAAYGEHRLAGAELGWRERLEFLARERWRLIERHQWLLDLNMSRMPLGPHILDVDEAVYAAIAASGLTGADIVAIYNLIIWQILGAARAHLTDTVEERRTGTSAEAYWSSRASFWGTYFDPERFPTMLAIWNSGGFDDEDASSPEVVIGRLLDAVELMIAERRRD
jgi:Tetracyclin repressor-like, C-terminal domain